MDGYTHLFQEAALGFERLPPERYDSIFENFRNERNLFGFTENGDNPPDNESISIAKSIDETLYNYYLEQLKGRKCVGYGKFTPFYSDYNNLDSRHIMMSSLLFKNVKPDNLHIVEIGGGYGNWLFLNRNQAFKKWTIIDLPHISKLQEYYLHQLEVEKTKYKLLTSSDFSEVESEQVDVVIGAHSLSELNITYFTSYFNKIIKNAKFLLYCYHRSLPSIQLINKKNEMINSVFDLFSEVHSEEGRVSNCLFINRNHSEL